MGTLRTVVDWEGAILSREGAEEGRARAAEAKLEREEMMEARASAGREERAAEADWELTAGERSRSLEAAETRSLSEPVWATEVSASMASGVARRSLRVARSRARGMEEEGEEEEERAVEREEESDSSWARREGV